MIDDRPMPLSHAAEQGVLSCVLQDCLLIPRLVDNLPDSAFYFPAHRIVSSTLRNLVFLHEPAKLDFLMIMDSITQTGALDEAGGEGILHEIYGAAPTSVRFDEYMDIVRDMASKRAVIRTATEAINLIYENESLPLVMEVIEAGIAGACNTRSGVKITSFSDVLEPALREITSPTADEGGYSTGLTRIDKFIVGLKKRQTYVIAARPSVGKSALAHNIAFNFATKIGAVGLISLEMDAVSIAKRILGSAAKIDTTYFRHSDVANLVHVAGHMKNLPLYIEESPSGTVAQLKMRARALHAAHGIKILIVDYLQLFNGANENKNNNRERDVAELSGACKAIAREFNIPVIELCQLNRSQTNDRPRLSNLRESGSIEQDADVVILLHRKDNPFDEAVQNRIQQGGSMEVEAIIAKNRNGRVGNTVLQYYPKYTLFTDEQINYRSNP